MKSNNKLDIAALAMALLASLATTATANVTISSAATKNMTCSGGLCIPTNKTAILNVSDLENMLASGNATVTTLGSGNIQASNIVVDAALTWSSKSGLTLTAAKSIAFDASVSVTGKGGLTLNDAGTESLAFYKGANVTFSSLSSALTINGNAYALVGTVAELASDADASPSGYFALAANYNAAGDGTYSSAPVQNPGNWFTGVFEGLGNAISNLTIVDGTASGGCDALIFSIDSPTISNFGMVNVSITSTGTQGANGAGAIACGPNAGSLVWRSYATGTISMQLLDGGGGLCACGGSVVQSWANVAMVGTQGDTFGGLDDGANLIQQSFSMGPVSCSGSSCTLGGLDHGANQVVDSYSISPVSDTCQCQNGDGAYLGGLFAATGEGNVGVTSSYAAGKINSLSSGCQNGSNCVGGLFGQDAGADAKKHVYWDTSTTGVNVAAGNESTDPGTVGLKNSKFIAQLPKGFSNKIWAQSPKINNGLPYLIANPPPG